MDSAVKVTANVLGNVVIPSPNNSEYGHIRVEQERIMIDETGFARKKNINALIQGLVTDLKSFNWKKDQILKGNIIVKEQLKPFNMKNPEKDYKIAGKTGIICCIDGQPIYRKTFYKNDSAATDIFILDTEGNRVMHNNNEEIRDAYKNLSDTSDTPLSLSDIDNM